MGTLKKLKNIRTFLSLKKITHSILQLLAIASKISYNIRKKGGDIMANTTPVYARIDTDLKNSAEEILSQLGISPSSAIQMFYNQIILKNGIPFDLRIPANKPLAIAAMNREQIDAELKKGIDSIKEGKIYSANEVDSVLAKEYGI